MRKNVNPKTLRELLSQWDRGEAVWSVSMGGLGPGYDQAIQILVMEILRDFAELLAIPNIAGDPGLELSVDQRTKCLGVDASLREGSHEGGMGACKHGSK